MNKKKSINFSLITIIFIILSFVFGGEYIDFQYKQEEINSSLIETIKEAENFKITDIKDIKDTTIFYTPDINFIDTIVEKINSAQTKVYLEVYMFTEKRTKEAIKNAYKRGIDVKVLLEKNPYMAGTINNNFYNELQKYGVNIAWSNTENFALNHSKFFIIDNEAIISTGNITYSTFKYNKDFFVFIKEKELIQKIEEIFLNDFAGEKFEIYDDSIVLSPSYSRIKIETLLKNTKENLKIYMQYFKDNKMNDILLNLQKKGVSIQIIVNKNNLEDEEIKLLEKSGIEIKTLKTTKMHSKVIISDKKYMFVGSENFSSYSLDKNRELGIIMKNEDLIKKVLESFKKDWKEN